MGLEKWVEGSGLGPLAGMIMVQVISTGLQILSRVILSHGTFVFAYMAYRLLLAAFCIAPFAFFLERGSITKLSFKIVFWIFLSSLTGITMAMGMFYYGLRDTTATYATNFLNLIPIVTFIFSIILRMEKLKLNTRRGKLKVIGTLVCVAGALTVGLYKGKVFVSGNHHPPHHIMINHTIPNWTRGSLLLIGSCLSYAAWFIVQAKLLKLFPAKYWATMLTCISASLQTAVVGLCIDRSKSSWKLGLNLQLITIIYSAVLASAVSFYLISWAVSSKGPTYPSMFNPLSLIFIAIIEAIFLGQDISTGSLVGMVVIIVGLYSFLWGSGRQTESESSSLPKSASFGGGDGGGGCPELAGLQLTATVVPTASPVSLSDDEQHI